MNELTIYGADWCGYTKKLKSDITSHNDEYSKAGVSLNYVNCAESETNHKLCVDQGVTAFPTLKNQCGELRSGYANADSNINFANSCNLTLS